MEDHSRQKGPCLPLLSLQLLVPPLRLGSAAILHTIQKKIVRDYGILDEFVTMVTELVPELLHDRERSLLSLGLRVQLVLELCRSEQPADLKTIQPHLNRIQRLTPLLSTTTEANDLLATISECNFVGFIQNLLKDPDQRARFFQDVYPATFGPMYDESLQMLMSQFLSRLNNILPLPNLQEASSMLSGAPNILEECLESMSHPEGLGPLLEYHKDLSQLDEDDESVSSIGDCIFNALFQSVMENIPTDLEVTKLDVPVSALTDHIYSSHQILMVDYAMLTEGEEDESMTIKEEDQTEMESKKQFVDIIEGSQDNVPLHNAPQVLYSPEETLSWDSSVTEVQIGANSEVCDKGLVSEEGRVDVEPVYETDWLITEDGEVEPFDIIMLNEELAEVAEHSEVDRFIKDESDGISWISELNEHEGQIRLTDAIISSLRHTPKVKLIRLDPSMVIMKQNGSHLKTISRKAAQNNPSRKVCQGTSTSKSCLLCRKIFSRVSDLRLHERTHERRALPRFSCSMCKKHFRYMYDLKMHRVNLCQENEPDRCPAETPSPVGPGEDGISEDLRALDCKVCGETFPYPSVLRRHIKRTHLGVNLFECSKCSEQFTIQSDFVKHQLEMCQDNVAKSTQKSSKKLKYNKPLKSMKCEVCGKIFAKPSRLEYHMLTHNDERPYKCTYCEKTFKYLTHFRRHGEVCPLVGEKQMEDTSIDRAQLSTDQNDKMLSNNSILLSNSEQNQLTLEEKSDIITHSEIPNELKETGNVGNCQTAFSQNLENGPGQIEVCTHPADRNKDRKDTESAFGVTMSKPSRRSRGRKSTIVTDDTSSEVCLICKLSVKGSMKCHLRSHSDMSPYSCPHCKVKFMFKNGLIKHMKGEHNHADAETLKKIERSLKCDECGKEFMFTSSLRQHKYTHNPLYCIECKRLFPSMVTFSTHRLMHKPRFCVICQERLNGLMQLNQHYLEVHQFRGPYGCVSCERSYTDLKGLFKHERVHTGELPFKCPKCPKSFSTKFALATHNKTHTKEKPFLCWDCGKFYRNPGALRSHRLSIHANPGDKRFPCSHCGKDYSLKSTLSNHVKNCHSGVRYPCTYCGKQFLSASSLTRHDLIHTQERPFPCTECDKSFRSASELKIHTRYHTGERPFKCEQCGKGFTQSYHLTDHRRMHTGEKPYQCPTCGKCFRSPKAVQKHIVIHTGEKPYKCSVCDRAFNRTDVLKAHEKKSH